MLGLLMAGLRPQATHRSAAVVVRHHQPAKARKREAADDQEQGS